MIHIVSYGHKYNNPPNVHVALDCRSLWNPHGQERFRKYTGLDPEVCEVMNLNPTFPAMAEEFADLIMRLMKRGPDSPSVRDRYNVGFGCHGGRHRSVWMAEAVAKRLLRGGHTVTVYHRELLD